MTAGGTAPRCIRCGGEMFPTGCVAETCGHWMCLDCGSWCDLLTGGVCAVIEELDDDLKGTA